jgi:hypothetical protein
MALTLRNASDAKSSNRFSPKFPQLWMNNWVGRNDGLFGAEKAAVAAEAGKSRGVRLPARSGTVFTKPTRVTLL